MPLRTAAMLLPGGSLNLDSAVQPQAVQHLLSLARALRQLVALAASVTKPQLQS